MTQLLNFQLSFSTCIFYLSRILASHDALRPTTLSAVQLYVTIFILPSSSFFLLLFSFPVVVVQQAHKTTDRNLYYSSAWSEPDTPHTHIQTCLHEGKFCGCAVNAFTCANQIKIPRMKINLSASFTVLELLLRSAAGIINEHKLINEIKRNCVFV